MGLYDLIDEAKEDMEQEEASPVAKARSIHTTAPRDIMYKDFKKEYSVC